MGQSVIGINVHFAHAESNAMVLPFNNWVIFLWKWFYFVMLLIIHAIFCRELVQYNEVVVSTVDTDGLVL